MCEGVSGSPKHRISIAPSASLSVEILADGDSDVSFNTSAASGSLQVTSATAVSSTSVSSSVIQQTSIDQSISSSSKSAEATEADAIVAEPLGKILEHKLIREKRAEMEKKLESLRKKHDKEKVRVSAQKSSEQSDKKSKFYMSNKLVKRLSSKNM